MTPAWGSLKRLYFYGISFAALMTLVAGISLAVQSLLNVLFDGAAFSLSSNELAWGLSPAHRRAADMVLPLAIHHAKRRRHAGRKSLDNQEGVHLPDAGRRRSGFLAAVSYEILKWAMRAGEFPEFSLASILPWAMIWGYHWQIESAEGQRSMETRGIRRLYLYAMRRWWAEVCSPSASAP